MMTRLKKQCLHCQLGEEGGSPSGLVLEIEEVLLNVPTPWPGVSQYAAQLNYLFQNYFSTMIGE